MSAAATPDTVLWRFACPVDSHGEFDVWAEDWTDVPREERPEWMRDHEFDVTAEDVSATLCPACRRPGTPVRAAEL